MFELGFRNRATFSPIISPNLNFVPAYPAPFPSGLGLVPNKGTNPNFFRLIFFIFLDPQKCVLRHKGEDASMKSSCRVANQQSKANCKLEGKLECFCFFFVFLQTTSYLLNQRMKLHMKLHAIFSFRTSIFSN